MRGAFVSIIACGALSVGAAGATAAPLGGVYPVLDQHGGTTCQAGSSVDGAAGKGPGQTWTEGGGTTTPSSPSCDASSAPPPFDLSKFQNLYWGVDPNSMPGISLDGGAPSALTDDERMTFDPSQSSLAAGRLVFTGATHTSGCRPAPCSPTTATYPVDTKLTITVTNPDAGGAPVALTSPASLGLDPKSGGIVAIDSTVRRFTAQILFQARDGGTTNPFEPALDYYNSHNHTGVSDPQTRMSIGAVYWWVDRAPTADFTFPAPQNGQPVTFSSSASDPDGSVSSYAWDLGDGTAQSGTTSPNATATYGPGTHTVKLTVTDDEGSQSTATHSFTIDAPPADNSGGSSTSSSNSTPTGGTPTGGTPTGGTTGGTSGGTIALAASLAAAKQKLAKVLKSGLAATLKANQAATGKLKITLPRAVAKKLKLKGSIGTATVALTSAGTKAFKVKISKKAARKLKQLKKVTLVLSGTVADTHGSSLPVTKTVTVKK